MPGSVRRHATFTCVASVNFAGSWTETPYMRLSVWSKIGLLSPRWLHVVHSSLSPAFARPLMQQLLWLSIHSRIQYKLCTLMFDVQHGTAPVSPNSVTTKNVARLQRAQNAVARVVAWGTNRQSTSSSALLKHYHWLPIHHRIQFKIACITYKTIHTTQPAYLNSVLEHYTPARTLRSSDTNLLSVPRVRTCFGSRSFSVAAPTIWNSLPSDVRNSCSVASFRHKLKTFFFQRLAMSSAPSLLPQRLRFGESLADIARCTN